jgi:hypothetical protein
MPRLKFRHDVQVWIVPGTLLQVRSVERAAQVLIERWPAEFAWSPQKVAAAGACLRASKTRKPADVELARETFAAAAREAGILKE